MATTKLRQVCNEAFIKGVAIKPDLTYLSGLCRNGSTQLAAMNGCTQNAELFHSSAVIKGFFMSLLVMTRHVTHDWCSMVIPVVYG